jgi:hypothetical protein
MTDTREILETVPHPAPLGVAEAAAAIDACLKCVVACTSCADADLAEEDIDALRTCIARCVESADLCELTARLLSRPAHQDRYVVHRLLQACVRSCTSSADECARHAHHHRHCAVCERVCRACVHACSALLDAEAFEQLENLAGG